MVINFTLMQLICKGNYAHYMQKEIFEQPQAISDTLESRITKDKVMIEAFGNDAQQILIDQHTKLLVTLGERCSGMEKFRLIVYSYFGAIITKTIRIVNGCGNLGSAEVSI